MVQRWRHPNVVMNLHVRTRFVVGEIPMTRPVVFTQPTIGVPLQGIMPAVGTAIGVALRTMQEMVWMQHKSVVLVAVA